MVEQYKQKKAEEETNYQAALALSRQWKAESEAYQDSVALVEKEEANKKALLAPDFDYALELYAAEEARKAQEETDAALAR